MADVQIAVIDQENTQIALAVPGTQGPTGATGDVAVAQDGTAALPGIRFQSDTNTGIYRPGADQLAISTAGTGRLFVNANGSIDLGSTGVTASPTVRSASSPTLTYSDGTNAAYTGLIGTQLRLLNLAAGGKTLIQSEQDVEIKTTGGHPIIAYTANAERLRITSDGKVGIGTSSPYGKLTVNTAVTGQTIFNTEQFSIVNSATGAAGNQATLGFHLNNVNWGPETTYARVSAVLENGTSGATALAFGTAVDGSLTTPPERLRITSDGKVGIGTSSPNGKLDVADGDVYITKNSGGDVPGVTSQSLYLRTQSGDLARLYSVSSGAGGPGGFGGTLYVQTKSDNGALADRIAVLNNGNVGIGTITPQGALDINGGTNVSVYIRNSTNGTSSTDGLLIGNLGGEYANYQIWNYENGDLRFGTNATERARIDSSGRLLVGTSSSRFYNSLGDPRLQVEGTTFTGSTIGATNNQATIDGAYLILAKTRGTSLGSHTIVNTGDLLGSIWFQGADGTALVRGAVIEAVVDGTPGTSDMPGRLVFSTTADGAATPTERMRIKNNGTINFSNVATYADNAAAAAGGLAVGDVYRTATGQLMIRY